MHRHLFTGLLALAALGAASGAASAQNLLANPGFEDPVTADGPPFVGSWEAFSGGAGAGSGNSTNTPRTGAMNLELSITNVNNTFAGAFQDVTGLVPGTLATFSGFHQTPTSPTAMGVASEYRIEWRNATSEISRTPNVVIGPLSDQYTPFTVAGLVPAGADTARVVYAIQTFGGEPTPTNTGIVHLDDLSFVVVPEPTSIAALGAAGLLLGRKRR